MDENLMPVHSISFFLVSVLTNRAIISKSLRYKASQVAGLEPKNLSHLNKVLARDIAIGRTFIVKALGKHGEEKKNKIRIPKVNVISQRKPQKEASTTNNQT